MNRFLWGWLLVFSTSVLAGETAGNATILIVGDSLSAAYGLPVDRGWVALLRQRLKTQGYPQQVVNASISGDTTRGGLDRLPPELRAHRPGVVIIELGANDGLRGLSTEDMAANLAAMVKAVQAQGGRALLVRMKIPPNYGPAYTRRFEAVYDDVAKQTGATLAPFLMDGVAGDPALIQEDGLHPTAAAQPRLLENLWPSIRSLLAAPVRAASGVQER